MAYVSGIDTGTWRVRVATMEGSFRRWTLRDVVEMESSVGIGPAIEAIRANEPNWAQAERVAALPLDKGAVRVVKLPFTDRTTIAKALPAEIESNVPYDLEEMVLNHRLLDQDKSGSRSLAIIARKTDLAAHLELLKSVHTEPRLLVLDAEALATYSDRGNQAIIDIGHSRTIIALCQNGNLIAARLVPLGGHQLTTALAEALGVSEAEAEVAKHAARVSAATANQEGWTDPEPTDAAVEALSGVAQRALVEALDDLIAEVRARLISLEDELGLGVDEVLLAGGGSQLEGLAARLTTWTGLPCRSVIVPGGHPPACALAVALARLAAGEEKATDLRVGEFAYRGHAEVLWNVVSYGGLATVAALLVGALVVGVRVTQAWDRMSELDGQITEVVTSHFPDVSTDRLKDTSTALAVFQERADATQARVDALGSIVGGEPPTLGLLKKLSDVLPPNGSAKIDVRELNLSASAVSFKAETDSYESAGRIEESLKAAPGFASAKKSDEKKSGDFITFNMSIPLGEVAEATPEDEAPAEAPEDKEGK